MTRLGRSTLLLNSKAPEQMTAEYWRWRPRWNRLASSASCFGSSACLQSVTHNKQTFNKTFSGNVHVHLQRDETTRNSFLVKMMQTYSTQIWQHYRQINRHVFMDHIKDIPSSIHFCSVQSFLTEHIRLNAGFQETVQSDSLELLSALL